MTVKTVLKDGIVVSPGSHVNGCNVNYGGITVSVLLPSVLVHLLMDFTYFEFTWTHWCKGWATKLFRKRSNTLTTNCCNARYLFDCFSQSMTKIELFIIYAVYTGLFTVFCFAHRTSRHLGSVFLNVCICKIK